MEGKLRKQYSKFFEKEFTWIGGNNPDDYQKSWTDPPYFVDPLEILNISCPMYNGKHERNLLCAVDVENYGQLLPDMKIKESIWKL